MNFNLFIAGRIGKKSASNGRLSRISNTIATVSVAISFMVMIVAIAIANGFREEIRGKASGFSGDITLTAPGVSIENHLYPTTRPSYIGKLDSLEFIKSVNAVSYRSGLLKNGNEIQGIVVKGIDGRYDMEFFRNHLIEGEIPQFTLHIPSEETGSANSAAPSNEIIISKRLANMLNYKVGDKAQAYFIGDDVRIRLFTIAGIFDARLEEIDKSLIIADAGHISKLNGWKDGEVSGYEVLLKKSYRDNTAKVAAKLEEFLYNNTADNDPSLVPTTLQERYYILFDWLHLLDTNVYIILALMIAVAGFNMVSGLLIILFERISHIGLLKSLGMRNKDIASIFLYRASFIVLKGMAAGNLAAILFCLLESQYRFIKLNPTNYFVSFVPIEITPSTIIAIDIAAFITVMLILTIPCHIIGKISPSKTLAVK